MSVITITEKDMKNVLKELYGEVRCVIFEWLVPKEKIVSFDGEDLTPGVQGEFYDIDGKPIRCLIHVWVGDKDWKVASRAGIFDSHWTGPRQGGEDDALPLSFLDPCGGWAFDNKTSKWGVGARYGVIGLPTDKISVQVTAKNNHQLDMNKSWIRITFKQIDGPDPRKKS